jgi:hypothetical protein
MERVHGAVSLFDFDPAILAGWASFPGAQANKANIFCEINF